MTHVNSVQVILENRLYIKNKHEQKNKICFVSCHLES